MARKIIDIGIIGNDGLGDSIRDSFRKVNDNFYELYGSIGLGDRLSFTSLGDTPDDYDGLQPVIPGEVRLVTTNSVSASENPDRLVFERIVGGDGIVIAYNNGIVINSTFPGLSADDHPQLGGDLLTGVHTILELETPILNDEAVNKKYADSKIALAGVNAINPATNNVEPAFGRMTGPLILSRNPTADDDAVYDGLVAATKQYVDNSAFGSVTNLYVATSGSDSNLSVSPALQGRNLAYAFKTINSALQRANELVLTAPLTMAPYKKILTYNNGAELCTLTNIITSPASGQDFAADPLMSVDTIKLNTAGFYYYVGDILTIEGGSVPVNGESAKIQVLATSASPGPITAFKLLSSGVYDTSLPGIEDVPTTTANPNGIDATFDITYKVNNINITNQGTGYVLVSVRINGDGESGFGTAVLDSSGAIADVIIKNTGAGFTTIPTVVADLPRFLIKTEGNRTDASGDFDNNTEEAYRTRDLNEGLYFYGETSGAMAQILTHTGNMDGNGNEEFDVDIISGTFEVGEHISYGDAVRNQQINVIVESGTYYENLPLKIPENVSLSGDSIHRSIIKPRADKSASQWAFQQFRRDVINDSLVTAATEFGYHYLTDPALPVYPKINNVGNYRAAAQLIDINKDFILAETIGWIDYQIANDDPDFIGFEYDINECRRDINDVINAILYDIKYGEYNQIVSTGLMYYQTDEGIDKITNKLTQLIEICDRVDNIIQDIIINEAITDSYQTTIIQIIDKAFIVDPGVSAVITDLFTTFNGVISNSPALNRPLANSDIDVFLINDASTILNITSQEHNSFMVCLDPTGKIVTTIPTIAHSSSTSQSKNTKTFAGGMFIDGFAGNIKFSIESIISPTQLEVSGLARLPQLPCSVIVNGEAYRINYIRNFAYSPTGSTAHLILDITTPWTLPLTDPATDTFELLAPGIKTVVANEFTQGNDMGYGILATNNSTVKANNVPTSYCYASLYALNGATIKSTASSSAYGVHGLIADGADPYEVPIFVSLHNDPVQSVACYSQAQYVNNAGDTVIYVYNYDYEPLGGSELEIKFDNDIYAYAIESVETIILLDSTMITKLNLSPSDSDGLDGLLYAVPHDTKLSFKSKTQLVLNGDAIGTPVRPSTALRFNEDLETVYRILQISEDAASTPGLSQVLLNENLQYVNFVVSSMPAPNQITGSLITGTDVVGYKFMFDGDEFYVDSFVNTGSETTLTLDSAISSLITTLESPYTAALTMPAGDSAANGIININISLIDAISHTFNDIGTGSYADTNIPLELYGYPVNEADPVNEVIERNVGRVFYTSIDQDGNFNVGPYFGVDQGTGKVTLAADIALSNLDGLGFKRGVTISEFSIDPTFSDNSTIAVPTENTIRTYIDRRLGVAHNGTSLIKEQMIPANVGGFLPLTGQLAMKGNIDLQDPVVPVTQHKVVNLGDPTDPQDAVNLQSLTFDNIQDTTVTTPAAAAVLAFTGTNNNAVNADVTGDISFTLSGNTLTTAISSGVINDTNVASAAAISQNKLALRRAETIANGPVIDPALLEAASGVTSFDPNHFTSYQGWASIRMHGITTLELQTIMARTVLGNSSSSPGNVEMVPFDDIIDAGLGIKKLQYTTTGVLSRTNSGSYELDSDYDVLQTSALNDSNALIQRDVNGDFAARTAKLSQLKIDDHIALDTQAFGSGGIVKLYGWQETGGISIGSGPNTSEKITIYNNETHEFKTQNGAAYAPIRAGSVRTTALTTGAEATAGTITGDWSLTGNSKLESTYSADLAEYYEGDKEYDAGTVLVFGGDKEVTTDCKHMNTRVAGVVSEKAAFAMFKACPGLKNLVALQGRVPVRVVGKILKGDLIVTSTLPGVAMSAETEAKAGSIIGKALENYDSNHIGLIEVAVGRS